MKTLLLLATCLAVSGNDKVPSGLTAGSWAEIRAVHQRHRHAAQTDGRGPLTAPNQSQQWTTRFDGQGFLVQPDRGGWNWGLALQRYGFAGQERAVGQGQLTSSLNRIKLNRDGVEEWWINDARGLEHGFVVRQRPAAGRSLAAAGNSRAAAGNSAGPLRFDLAVRGTLRPRVSANGKSASFHNDDGATVVSYGGLKVWDADGHLLSSRMEASENRLMILVEEQGARYPLTIDPIAQQAYLKASVYTGGDYLFGNSVAVSGNTVVVGAPREDSNGTGINGAGTDNSATDAGAAYVFVRSGGTWTQQAYLKASNTDPGDNFGYSVAISGNTIVVGALSESGGATGVNGNAANNGAAQSGAAYVFVRSGSTWTQQAYLKASNTEAGDNFGVSVGIDGDTAVVGAQAESSNATGVNGNQANNSAAGSGAVYVFVRSGTTWTQQAYLKASNAEASDNFGNAVAISGDTILTGAQSEASNATGANGNQANNAAAAAGAAYVFVRSGTTWTQQAYLKASNAEASDAFGYAVAIAGDTAVIAAQNESSNATGVNANQANNGASQAGAAYVFVRSGSTWAQQAYLKASNTEAADKFGSSVAIYGDMVAVGASQERSNATGLNGDQTNNSLTAAGAVYLFVRAGAAWTQQAYLKASNTRSDQFGVAVAVSADLVVVGAYSETSSATGVNGDQFDYCGPDSGAVYVFDAPPLPPSTSDITVSPAVVPLTCVVGRTPPSFALQVQGTGGFSLTPQLPWLTLLNSSGTAGRPFTLALQSCDMAPGQYSSLVYFRAGSAEVAAILVQLNVTGPPELFSTPSQLRFSREAGAPEPAAQRLWIVARHVNVNYTLASASPWLEIINVGTQTPQQIEVRLKQPPAAIGSYQAEILVASAEAVNSPLRIPVTYAVTPVAPKVSGGVYDYFALSNGLITRGALATVFGTDLAARRSLAPVPYPMILDGVVVKINGRPCPIFYTDPGQLAFQLPVDTALGTATLVVERNGVTSAEVSFTVQ
ncbi:MAG: hypothetical protein NTZ56_13440 [Acidobacteria bacterium]|nr:hypothetical protein [Acidobacteriota bacterium]